MSVLSACQDAIARLVARRPNSVFASDDEICVEIASLANEAATDIAKACDWQALIKYKLITGDGVSLEYPFPDDYDRMVQGTEIYDPNNWCWGYTHINDFGEWTLLEAQGFTITPGAWSIRGNKFHFYPAPTGTATFPYVSSYWAAAAGGAGKALFDRDDDDFVLEDRLLTLALIWRWKSMKGMDYQEDIKNSDIALSQAMARDRGARVIRKNGGYIGRLNANVAWPWSLG